MMGQDEPNVERGEGFEANRHLEKNRAKRSFKKPRGY